MNAVLGVELGKVKEEGVVIGHLQGIDVLPMMKVIIGIIREEHVMMMIITTTATAVVVGMVVDGMIYMTLQVVANLAVAVRNMKKMTLVVVHVKSKTRNQNGRHTLSHRVDLSCLMQGRECFMNHTQISFTIPRRRCIIRTRSSSILHIKQI